MSGISFNFINSTPDSSVKGKTSTLQNAGQSYSNTGAYDETFRLTGGNPRHAFRLSTVAGLALYPPSPAFYLWVNPSECSWRVPLRTTIEPIQGGAVHHEWDSTGIGTQAATKFDQPVINFTFQSGNLLPYGNLSVAQACLDPQTGQSTIAQGNPPVTTSANSDDSIFDQIGQAFKDFVNKNNALSTYQSATTQNFLQVANSTNSFLQTQPIIPPGLGNFYDFLNLLNQPNTISSQDATDSGGTNAPGQANYVQIDYFSMIMPSIQLQGFFTQEGVQWNDSADNPLGITSWGASFVVFNSTPNIFDNGALRSKYNSVFGPGY